MNEALSPGSSMTATIAIRTTWGRDDGIRMVADFKRLSGAMGDRILLEVKEPEEGRGTLYQILEAPDGSLERWAWQPTVRRLRRVAGVERTDPFMGTEFNYEDLGFAVPVERARGEVRRVRDGDRTLVRLDSPPYHYYSRVVTLIDPETNLPVRVSFYDEAGQRFREESFEDVRGIAGHPLPMRIVMRNLVTGAQSVLTFSDVEIDVPLDPAVFAESTIRKRLGYKPAPTR